MRLCARPLTKSPFALLALCLWVLACPTLSAEDEDPNALNQQVNQLIEQGKYQKAVPISERAVEIAKRVRGPDQSETAEALNNLGLISRKVGDYTKAEPLYQEALRIRQKVLGPEHPDTATSLDNLGELYGAMGRYTRAEPFLQEALRVRQKVLGPEHPDSAMTWPRCTWRYARTPKPNRFFKKHCGYGRSSWAGTSRHRPESQ
jgi:tetratricopeptide (TPR) repeat protein